MEQLELHRRLASVSFLVINLTNSAPTRTMSFNAYSDCLCTFLNPEPEWASDDSPLYVQYCDAFHRDLRYVYRLNGWAFCGTDDAGEPRPWATIDVIMQTEKNRLLPWGGFMGFTWPKLSPWERPELQDYGSVE